MFRTIGQMPASQKMSLVAPILALMFLAPISGCASHDPLVPAEVYQEINADGREWTYDVAWQNTRMLTFSVETGQLNDLSEQALILSARLHRLETARADAMADAKTARTLSRLDEEVNSRTLEENTSRLGVIAPELELVFDAGDFSEAKDLALEVLVIGRWLEDRN